MLFCGDRAALEALYAWFLPLLRLDTGPTFVQQIKLAQEMVGLGSARVRPPRLELAGAEREEARRVIQHALDQRPNTGHVPTVNGSRVTTSLP